MSETKDRIARAICNSRHGGYEAFAEDRAIDARWLQAVQDAQWVLDELVRIMDELPVHLVFDPSRPSEDDLGTQAEMILRSDIDCWMLDDAVSIRKILALGVAQP